MDESLSFNLSKKVLTDRTHLLSTNTMATSHHPFSDAVMQVPLPSCFEPHKITKYEGFSDSEDHLETFIVHMLMSGSTATDPLFCKVFPCTITKYGLRWLFSLPQRLIDNVSQLSNKFLTQFTLSRTCRKMEEFLIEMYQPYGGLSQEYVSRFNRVVVQINSLDPLLYLQRMREGPTLRAFLNFVHSNPPLTPDDILQRVKSSMEKEILLKEKEEMGIYRTSKK